MPGLLKRSLVLAGHRTSLALEAEFWRALETMAAQREISVAALIAEIDVTRAAASPDRLLASACRVEALAWALSQSHCGPT